MECSICIETIDQQNLYICNVCKYTNCIDCHKKYLLTSTQDQHCINCRSIIPYDLFLQKFNKKNWIFDTYKTHRYNVLWEREQSLFPQTVYHISLKKQEKIILDEREKLFQQIALLNIKLNDLGLKQKNKTTSFDYTYACPLENCKGFLNKDFKCDLCNSSICAKCYTIKSENDIHECSEELIETFNAIKKEAKPCPTCGEFISKISGCDQMFCIKCATAFSWKTGLVEKGIIHNPHAHAFFQNNPNAQQNYLNEINNQNNNNCRPPIPDRFLFKYDYFHDLTIYEKIIQMHRKMAEFRQYSRNRLLIFIQNNNDKNLDLRMRYINDEINEKNFKQVLHSRDKKIYYMKIVCQTVIYAYEIGEIILWTIVDIIKNSNGTQTVEILENIQKNVDLVYQLIDDTNNNLSEIAMGFKYKSQYYFDKTFKINPYISIN